MNFFETLKGVLPASTKSKIKRLVTSVYQSVLYIKRNEREKKFDPSYVVFICKGNVCRSVFSEYYLKSILAGEQIKIESYGFDVCQGNGSPPDALSTAASYGLDMSDHNSKSLDLCNLGKATLIVLMEYDHYTYILNKYPNISDKIYLLKDFLNGYNRYSCNIYDPFMQGKAEFEGCFKVIKKSVDGLRKNI